MTGTAVASPSSRTQAPGNAVQFAGNPRQVPGYGIQSASGGWAVVQSAPGTAHLAASGTVTLTKNVTAGNKIIVYVTLAASLAPSVTGVTDAAANAWTLIGRIAGTNPVEASIWALDVPAADAGTKPVLTAAFNHANIDAAIIAHEVSGLLAGNTAAMCDGSPATLTGNTAATGSPAYSTTAVNEFLVSLYGDFGDNNTTVTAAGWTADPNNVTPSTQVPIVLQYKNSTGGAETDGFTGADTVGGWEVIEVAFKHG